MYTQCPDCATVFRITAEALRAAQGDVRCGVCSTSFNALENLSEREFKASADDAAPSPDDSMTVEEMPGSENIELSAPIELVAVPDVPDAPASPPAAETGDDEALAMEFHGGAEDLVERGADAGPTRIRTRLRAECETLPVRHPDRPSIEPRVERRARQRFACEVPHPDVVLLIADVEGQPGAIR